MSEVGIFEVDLPFQFEGIKKLEGYDPENINLARQIANELKLKTVIHFNSTPRGGGVAEMLKSQVPLERSLGLNSRWFYFSAPQKFFNITKKIHNLFQGGEGDLTPEEEEFYFKVTDEFCKKVKLVLDEVDGAVFVVHDPQVQPIVKVLDGPKISRLHIDISCPSEAPSKIFPKILKLYNRVVVSSPEYVKTLEGWGIDERKLSVVMPAIDPTTPKNSSISPERAKEILQSVGIDTEKPLLVQVSRFDPWKDQPATVRAWKIAKGRFPDLQLVLAGIMLAQDDPEAQVILQKVRRMVEGEKDVKLFWSLEQIKPWTNDEFINALFTLADVVMQKSIREGFGLVVTEAMWKGKPVIGGRASGILLQIKDGENGFIVDNFQEAGEKIIKLLEDESLRRKIGERARETVRKNFLISRLVREMIEIYKDVSLNV